MMTWCLNLFLDLTQIPTNQHPALISQWEEPCFPHFSPIGQATSQFSSIKGRQQRAAAQSNKDFNAQCIMRTSASNDIEYLETILPPVINLEGLDNKVLPKYLPQLSKHEQAPRMVHPDEMKIYSVVIDILVGQDSDGKSEDNDTDFEDMSEEELENIKNCHREIKSDVISFIAFIYNYKGMRDVQACCTKPSITRCTVNYTPPCLRPSPVKRCPPMMWTQNHVQVEKVIQKDGAAVKKILPILIKAEPDQEHTTKEPSIMTLYQPHLPPKAQPEQLLHEEELQSYSEEATDDAEYLSDDKTQVAETDSSAAELMVEELTKVDVHEFDEVLENISAALKQAAQGYDNLRTLLPQLPVHEVPKLVETSCNIHTIATSAANCDAH